MSSAPEPRFRSRTWEHFARPAGGGRFRLWRLGVVLLLVCGAILLLERRASRKAPDAAPPADASATQVRAMAPDEPFDPPQMARLAASPARLAWPSVGAGAVYRVRMVDESGAVLWESAALGEASADLPDDLRARLATGGRFGWRVMVTDAAGGAERKMPFREFEIAAP